MNTTVTFEKGKRYIVYGRRRGGKEFNYEGFFLGTFPGLDASDEDRYRFRELCGTWTVHIPISYVVDAEEVV